MRAFILITQEPPETLKCVDDNFGCFDLAQVARKGKRFGSGFWTAAATSSSAIAFRAASTAEKSRANRIAVERPMPWLAPVTIATEFFMMFLHYCYVMQIGYERTDL